MTAFAPRSAPALAGRLLYVLIAGLLAAAFLFPLAWSAFSSVHGRASSGVVGFTSENYERLWSYGEGLPAYLANTFVVVALTVGLTLVVAVLGGYAFARFDFRGKNVLFGATLAILMVPHATILIPLYVLLGKVGLTNSLIGLSLVLLMFQLPFSLFMMRNSFEAVPRELDEAALVDGCTSFTALRAVLLPAVMPGIVTVALFAFLTGWNEFIAALILLNDGSKFTLPVALVSLQQGDWGAVDFGALQAGIIVAAIPCLLLFLLLQRAYMSGFTAGAIKG
jgi:multiple sugar transport system permease protein